MNQGLCSMLSVDGLGFKRNRLGKFWGEWVCVGRWAMIAAGWTAISHMSAHIFGLRSRGQRRTATSIDLLSVLAQANTMSFSFINLSPESILRDAPQSLGKETTPSDCAAHPKQWVRIIENLLHKKLPSDEKAWDTFVTSQNDVEEVLNLVSLQSIPESERATMSWEQLFDACGEHFRVLQSTNRGKQCTPYFRLAMIALSVIATEYEPRDYVFNWLRRCITFCPGPEKGLGDESLRKLVKAVKNGITFIDSFTDVLGQRAHELPFHG